MTTKKPTDLVECVESLIRQAENNGPDSALKLTQAACNAANALRVLHDMKTN